MRGDIFTLLNDLERSLISLNIRNSLGAQIGQIGIALIDSK